MLQNNQHEVHNNTSKGCYRPPKLFGMMIPRMSDLKKESLPKTLENLNRLLKGESGENYDNLVELVSNDENLNTYEQSIRLIIIDSLKSKDGVVKALLSDDVRQIKRALHCRWFFEDAVTPSFYETNIFPKVSFSTRCKIINKLSKYIKLSDHAEQLFGFIRQNYGSKYAEILLPKCRPDFISSYISEYKPLFSHNTSIKILIKIVQRHPKLILPMLENMCHKDHPFNHSLVIYTKVFLCLARYHPNLFIPFFEKNYSSLLFLRFGAKLTRNLGSQLQKIVLNSAGELQRGVINELSFFKVLDFQGEVDFLASIITSKKKELTFENWFWAFPNFSPFIKSKPAAERAKLLETVFKKVYDKNLWDQPELWKIPLLELMPLDIRERCVEVLSNDEKYSTINLHCSADESESDRSTAEQLIYLLRCENSIPKLKEIIKKTPSAEKRKNLVREMAKSCSVNNDLQSLQAVCEYVATYHRNDDSNLIRSFLLTINQSFSTKKFNLNLWTALEEIGTISVLSATSAYDAYHPIMEKNILFRLENNLDPTEQVKNLVKFSLVNRAYIYSFINNVQLPLADKLFYLYYNELIQNLDKGNFKEEIIKLFCLTIVYTLNDYNKWHKKKRILSKELKGLIFHLDKVVKDCKYDVRCLELDSYLKYRYAHEIFQLNFEPYILMYLLKKNSEYVIKSISDILNDLYTEYNKYFKCLFKSKKIFDFYNVTDEIKKMTREKFKSTDSFIRKFNALKLHSHFADISEYEELVSEYIPKTDRIDYKNNTSEFVKMQITVPELIKNIKPDSKNFPLVFRFLMGDFLKPVLTSFNSACYNSPVGMVITILKEKIDAPVSVKKAILRNIAEISQIQEKLQFFIDLWEKEKHYSIRTVILQTISKCFLEEPTDESFNAVRKCILESDEMTIEARPDTRAIPARYINDYASAIWQFSDKLENVNSKNILRNSLVKSFTPKNIWTLSDEFCERIIKSGIFDDESKLHLNYFTSYYLISNPHSMNRKLNTVLSLMFERKQNQKSIVGFLNILGQVSLQHPKHFHEIFDLIIKTWGKIFQRDELCDEFLTLQYYRAYHKVLPDAESKDTLNISINFANELKNVIANTPDYKELAIIFQTTLQLFFENIKEFKCPLDLIVVIRQLLTPLEREFAIIGILLLPDESLELYELNESGYVPITLDARKNTGYIVGILKNYKDDVVQIYYKRRFKLKKFKGQSMQS